MPYDHSGPLANGTWRGCSVVKQVQTHYEYSSDQAGYLPACPPSGIVRAVVTNVGGTGERVHLPAK